MNKNDFNFNEDIACNEGLLACGCGNQKIDGNCCGNDPLNQQELQWENQQMNSSSYPPTILPNEKQIDVIQKDLTEIKRIFSKLPCIKNCMSKFEVISSNTSANAIKTSEVESLQINFENINYNFVHQSSNQISSSHCRQVCEAGKICPEMLPSNCDDYFDKKCSCTVYCKKTLRYL